MKNKFKIVYAEDNKDIRDIYGTMIEGELDCELVEFSGGDDLINYLKEHNDVDVVLTDYNMPNGTGGDVYSYLKENGNKIPCLLISSDTPKDHDELSDFYETNKNNHSLIKPLSIEELLEVIQKLIPVEKDREYKPVRVERFLSLNPVTVDIYIQLSEKKYVKLINQGELFSSAQLQKYINDKQVEHFYIKSVEFGTYIKSFSEQLQSILLKQNLELEQRVATELTGVALIHDICNELGIDSNTIDTVNAVTRSSVSTIKKNNPRVFGLLSKMMKGDDFLYSHSLMTSYMCCEIAERMQWSSPEVYRKFSIAALLHDVGLSEEISKHNKLVDSITDELNHNDLKILKEHPQRNYELVHEIDSFPSDVGTIILNHHERPDGSGYPRGLGSLKTAPLSCTFILAHEFVHQLFANGSDCSKAPGILESMKNEFNVGNYKKPFEGLTKIVNKEPRP